MSRLYRITSLAAPLAIAVSLAACALSCQVRPVMVAVPGGRFLMGSPAGESGRGDDEIQRDVALSPFLIGAYEVTQREWAAAMGSNPSALKGESLPVESVSWLGAVAYCNRLSLLDGLRPCFSIGGEVNPAAWPQDARDVACDFSANGYRLPTEAEWEYACRAGSMEPFSFGRSAWGKQANFNGSFPYGDAKATTSVYSPCPVGTYPPNAFGLYDMHGNVWEWCWDWLRPYESGGHVDPAGASSGWDRSCRGGAWTSFGKALRSAARYGFTPWTRRDDLGFRVVRNP